LLKLEKFSLNHFHHDEPNYHFIFSLRLRSARDRIGSLIATASSKFPRRS